jgi:hypothetical protein
MIRRRCDKKQFRHGERTEIGRIFQTDFSIAVRIECFDLVGVTALRGAAERKAVEDAGNRRGNGSGALIFPGLTT